MNDWWAAMALFEKIFWFTALPASFILAIQMILSFMGLDGGDELDSDFDADTDVDGDIDDSAHIPFFTFRNFVAFFTVFGWTGIMMVNKGSGTAFTLFISISAGLGMMFLISMLYYGISKLTSTGGNYSLSQAIGKDAAVYVRIPKDGVGKVQIVLNGTLRELDAVTESSEDLSPQKRVKVTKISNNKLAVKGA